MRSSIALSPHILLSRARCDSRDTLLVTMPAVLVLWNVLARSTQPLSQLIMALTLRPGSLPPLYLLSGEA